MLLNRINFSRDWYADELHYHCKGKKLYIWAVRDERKNLVASVASSKRDGNAAKRFFRKAIKIIAGLIPDSITTDRWDAYPVAIRCLIPETTHKHGAIKYIQTT